MYDKLIEQIGESKEERREERAVVRAQVRMGKMKTLLSAPIQKFSRGVSVRPLVMLVRTRVVIPKCHK